MTRSITRTATIALAAAALAAPTASARPADTPPAFAKARRRDAAQAGHALARRHRRRDAGEAGPALARAPSTPATRPAPGGSSVNPRPRHPADGDRRPRYRLGDDRLGIAGSLLAIGAIAGIAGRTRRTARARIAA